MKQVSILIVGLINRASVPTSALVKPQEDAELSRKFSQCNITVYLGCLLLSLRKTEWKSLIPMAPVGFTPLWCLQTKANTLLKCTLLSFYDTLVTQTKCRPKSLSFSGCPELTISSIEKSEEQCVALPNVHKFLFSHPENWIGTL